MARPVLAASDRKSGASAFVVISCVGQLPLNVEGAEQELGPRSHFLWFACPLVACDFPITSFAVC